AVPGVKDVLDVGSGVAVIANGFWPAKRGRDELRIEWDPAAEPALSSEALREKYRRLADSPGIVARRDGDPEGALRAAKRTWTADYELPYLAHAPMEPLNCVVDLRDDSMEIWAGSQFQTMDRNAAAKVAGLEPEKVKLHTTFMGGGFGRRANPNSDYVVEAVAIAKRCGAPLQLVWTREDDMRAGYYRPMWHSRLCAGLDGSRITAWTHTIVGQCIVANTPFESAMVKNGVDQSAVEGAADLPYTIPNVRVDLHTTEVPV